MNVVDLLIIALLAVSIIHGVTQGAAMQLLSFGGFWGGLALGAVMAPVFTDLVGTPFSRAFVALASLFGMAAIGATIGRQLGTRAWDTLQRLRLGFPDAAFGALIAAVATMVAVWLFALIILSGPLRPAAAAVQSSSIVQVLVERLPPAPTVFSRIRALVDTSGFPQVFEGLEPPAPEPVELPDDPAVRAAVAAAGQATLRVVGLGCGGVQTGSSFVATSDLVVTNAHVIAGIERPTVEDRQGRRHQATPVLFDPDLDVAVMRVPGLGVAPLALHPGTVERGTGGAFLGYPGGGAFQAGPAAVARQIDAVGRDIYGRNLTQRTVYQLQAPVRQGNSGGPFVSPDGQVLGVIFAASTTDQSIGYALTSRDVAQRVQEASGRRAAVDTGPCT